MDAANRLLEAAQEIQQFCRSRQWRFCFIGGIAVQRWGEARLTRDDDLTVYTGIGDELRFIDELLGAFTSRIESAREFALGHRVLLLRAGNGIPLAETDSHFKRTRLSVEEPTGWVKRRFAAAAGCSARWWWHLRAGADAEMAARGQAGGGRHEPARRRPQTSDGGGYQAMRWANSKAGADWSSGSAAGSCAAAAAHSGGPRAGAMRGGAVGSPRWPRMSRTVGASVMQAMIRISAPQSGHSSGKTSSHRDFLRS